VFGGRAKRMMQIAHDDVFLLNSVDHSGYRQTSRALIAWQGRIKTASAFC
jgi:hypothetical protein